MTKFGLFIDLINIAIKLVVGFGLWRMAMMNKENYGGAYGIEFQGGAGDGMEGYTEKKGRIFPQPQGTDMKQMRDEESSEQA